jgi:hypothetical protein
MEDNLNQMADYAEKMRNHANHLRQIIENLYEASQVE